MPVKKEDFLKHLSDIASWETPYHNHKETIAWAAIVLYYVLIIEVVKDLHSWPFIATCIIGGAAIVVVYVLHFQYRLRKDAANLIAACYRLIAEYLPKDDECLQNVDFSVAPLQKEEKKFPKCDYRPIGHYPYILPNVLLDMMKKMNKVGHGPRIGLERGSYLIVLLGFIISFAIIWWSEVLKIIGKYQKG